MKYTLHLTKWSTGVFDIHTTGTSVCYIIYCPTWTAFHIADLELFLSWWMHLLTVLVNRSVLAVLSSWSDVCSWRYLSILLHLPVLFCQINWETGMWRCQHLLRLVSYLITVETEMEISTVLKVVNLTLNWTFTDLIGWLIGSVVKEKNRIGEYTVKPRFMNLIHSWRSFVNRNVRKPKLFPHRN